MQVIRETPFTIKGTLSQSDLVLLLLLLKLVNLWLAPCCSKLLVPGLQAQMLLQPQQFVPAQCVPIIFHQTACVAAVRIPAPPAS
jgi:hypothetical protein